MTIEGSLTDYSEWLEYSRRYAEWAGEEVKQCHDCKCWFVTSNNYKLGVCIECSGILTTKQLLIGGIPLEMGGIYKIRFPITAPAIQLIQGFPVVAYML
jgi:hypothetical protein